MYNNTKSLKVLLLLSPDGKGVAIMRRLVILMVLLAALSLFSVPAAMAAETVNFEPVRAPSKGADNAPVTIVEIADFM